MEEKISFDHIKEHFTDNMDLGSYGFDLLEKLIEVDKNVAYNLMIDSIKEVMRHDQEFADQTIKIFKNQGYNYYIIQNSLKK